MPQSTAEDVRKLILTFPPKRGDFTKIEAVEELVTPWTRRDSHFRSIITAWRRHLYAEYGMKLAIVSNVGYRILEECERPRLVRVGIDKTSRIVKRTRVEAEDIQPSLLPAVQKPEFTLLLQTIQRLDRAIEKEAAAARRIPTMPLPAPPASPQRAAYRVAEMTQARLSS